MAENDGLKEEFAGSRGIFADAEAGLDAGLGKFQSVQSSLKPEGVQYEIHCDGCGRAVTLVVEYPELVAVSMNLPPHLALAGQNAVAVPVEWAYSQRVRGWQPKTRCSGCSSFLELSVTSSEAASAIVAARARGLTNVEGERAIVGLCRAWGNANGQRR